MSWTDGRQSFIFRLMNISWFESHAFWFVHVSLGTGEHGGHHENITVIRRIVIAKSNTAPPCKEGSEVAMKQDGESYYWMEHNTCISPSGASSLRKRWTVNICILSGVYGTPILIVSGSIENQKVKIFPGQKTREREVFLNRFFARWFVDGYRANKVALHGIWTKWTSGRTRTCNFLLCLPKSINAINSSLLTLPPPSSYIAQNWMTTTPQATRYRDFLVHVRRFRPTLMRKVWNEDRKTNNSSPLNSRDYSLVHTNRAPIRDHVGLSSTFEKRGPSLSRRSPVIKLGPSSSIFHMKNKGRSTKVKRRWYRSCNSGERQPSTTPHRALKNRSDWIVLLLPPPYILVTQTREQSKLPEIEEHKSR